MICSMTLTFFALYKIQLKIFNTFCESDLPSDLLCGNIFIDVITTTFFQLVKSYNYRKHYNVYLIFISDSR